MFQRHINATAEFNNIRNPDAANKQWRFCHHCRCGQHTNTSFVVTLKAKGIGYNTPELVHDSLCEP